MKNMFTSSLLHEDIQEQVSSYAFEVFHAYLLIEQFIVIHYGRVFILKVIQILKRKREFFTKKKIHYVTRALRS